MRHVSDAYVIMSFMDDPSCSLKSFCTENKFCIFIMFSFSTEKFNVWWSLLCLTHNFAVVDHAYVGHAY